ncbi:hypothetical protein [Nocardioides sp.]|uniref:hypothetical protein n=1 Tax=Nocardioides sp. TaxID=35761 RepID=UPI00378434CE
MPHKVINASELNLVAVKSDPDIRITKTTEVWETGLNHLEKTEGWRIVTVAQGGFTKEPVFVLYKEA